MANLLEGGIEAGTWNKYQSRNPLQRWLVGRFLSTLRGVAAKQRPECRGALDVGCGEGVTTRLLSEAGYQKLLGVDFSEAILREARVANPHIRFQQANIYQLNPELHREDLVSACEVLEHLEHPELGLKRIAACCNKACLLSVPREPLFRSLNFAAGKYIGRFGNSPGHLNHWSTSGFVSFVSRHLEILEVHTPLPWTIVLARPITQKQTK